MTGAAIRRAIHCAALILAIGAECAGLGGIAFFQL